jgi:uncharacterized damage-inducible protein DinB
LVFTKNRFSSLRQFCLIKNKEAMTAIPKMQLLARIEAHIEQHLQIVTSRFQNLEEKKLLQPAADGGWSIAQCLEHLNSYARYYLPEIEKGLKPSALIYPATGTVKGTWLGRYFTRSMQPGPHARKFKAPKGHSPAPALEASRVIAEFIGQQEQLLALVRKAQKADLDKVRIPISISRWIKMRLGDVFQFLTVHDERHLQQALRHLS